MNITFTDKCKDKIVHAKDGIKFALKGYAFYTDQLPTTLKDLTIADLDSKYLVLNEFKPEGKTIDRLFDLTYIPSLEGSVIDTDENQTQTLVCKFGTYYIDVNKGLFKTLPINVRWILLFGEELSEEVSWVTDLNKLYVAAIIPYTTVFDENIEFSPEKIALQVSFADVDESRELNYQILVDEDFDEVTENEYLNNLGLIQLADNFALTPDSKNNDYTEDYRMIQYDTRNGESGPVNTKFFPGGITLFDKTEKINNPWNIEPKVYVGLKRPNEISLPHAQLSYFNKTDDGIELNSLSLTYDPDVGYLAVNQDAGIDNVQVDIFPEDTEEENKKCLKDKIKRANTTIDYSAVSSCKSFVKFDADNTQYGNGAYHVFEANTKNNSITSDNLKSEYVSLIYSDNNKLLGENNEVLVMDSDNNTFGNGTNDFVLINTLDTSIINNPRHYDNGDAIGKTTVELNNNTLIGVNGLDSTINTPNNLDELNFKSNNITFIGNNTNTTYVPETVDQMLEFDNIKSVDALFTKYYTIQTDTGSAEAEIAVRDYVNVDLLVNDSYSATQIVDNQALIGFNGLTVNRIPNTEIFWSKKEQIGEDPDTHYRDYYYYGEMTAQPNNNYSVVFGNYNANDNVNAVEALTNLSVTDAFALKGKYGKYCNSSFSSVFNNNFTFTTDEEYESECSVLTNIHRLYFKNTQDSLYAVPSMQDKWKTLTADEGDYGLNKIVVVGNGLQFTNQNITGHSPAEFASKYTNYDDNCRRINVFSIEKNSLQLVHNGFYDANPHYSATNVENIPAMFAVRGIDKVEMPYVYHFFSATNPNTNKMEIQKELYSTKNKFNLHNAVYSTNGIYIPLYRSSNDVYKLNFKNIRQIIDDNVPKATNKVDYTTLTDITKTMKQYTHILPTKGLKFKDKATGEITSYTEFDINRLIDWYKTEKHISFPEFSPTNKDPNLYTFYIINDSYENDLTVNGSRINKHGNQIQYLYKTKVIPKGRCLRVDYKGRFGVVNFDYWDRSKNSFYK